MYDDQIKLKGEHETMKRENQGEEHREKRPSNSIKPQNTTATYSTTHPNINKHSANTPNKLDIQPLPTITQMWPKVEVRHEE